MSLVIPINVFSIEGTYINPEGFYIKFQFRSNGKVKMSSQMFSLPITYNYIQQGKFIYIEDPGKGQIELELRGKTLWTDAPFMEGTYYLEGTRELIIAEKKIKDQKIKDNLKNSENTHNTHNLSDEKNENIEEMKVLLDKLKSGEDVPKEEIIKVIERAVK